MRVQVLVIVTYITSLTAGRRPAITASTGYICGTEVLSLTQASGAMTEVDMNPSTCLGNSAGYSSTFGSITINSGGYLYLANVSSTSRPILINGTDQFTWNSGGWVTVDLITQPATGIYIPIISYQAFSAATCITQNATSEVLPVGYTLLSTTTIVATYTSTAVPSCVLSIYVAPVTTTTTTTTTSSGGLVSGSEISILLNKDCTVFTTAVAQSIIGAYYDLTLVAVTTACASTLLNLICNGATTSIANAYCAAIYTNIMTSGTALNSALSPAATTSGGGSSSNNGLYGLLALIAIPVILVLLAVVWFMRPKPTPDEQTFDAEDAEQQKDLSVPAYAQPYPQPQPVSYVAATGPTPYSTPVTTPLMYRS